MSDNRKFCVYMNKQLVEQIQAEAERQDRTVSWLIQQAWKLAYPQLAAIEPPPAEKV